ncbi:MAG: glycosyltransferase [Lachnospiraceae bacterium]|nr:glycosyltransferase [Lachnospiraceae bacterium]
MKLSIIVPVYNMASDGKLQFCLDSLLNQTLKDDYEIITVDDASRDNSLEILRDYEQKYPDKIKVIACEKNHHQGGARNRGVEASKGEWIGFIDSDDWVVPDYYERLIKLGEEKGADVVGCNYCLVSSHTFTPGKEIHSHNKETDTGEFTPKTRKNYLKNISSSVIKIYLASLIKDNNLTFPEDIFYEDNAACPVWAMYFRHFEYIDEPLYFYYQHDASTVHTLTAQRCLDRLKAGEIMLSEMKSRGFFDEYREEIENIFTTIYYTNTVFSYMRMPRGRKYSFIRKIKKRMLEEFPDFRKNPSYGRFMDAEQIAYTDLFMKNSFVFFIKYILLWKYRDMKSK